MGRNNKHGTFLYQLGLVAVNCAESSPDNANLLKKNIQAIRTTPRNAQLTSFMESKQRAGIKVVTKDEPLSMMVRLMTMTIRRWSPTMRRL